MRFCQRLPIDCRRHVLDSLLESALHFDIDIVDPEAYFLSLRVEQLRAHVPRHLVHVHAVHECVLLYALHILNDFDILHHSFLAWKNYLCSDKKAFNVFWLQRLCKVDPMDHQQLSVGSRRYNLDRIRFEVEALLFSKHLVWLNFLDLEKHFASDLLGCPQRVFFGPVVSFIDLDLSLYPHLALE